MESPSNSEHEDSCSFCDRPASQAGPLVGGTGGAFICHACIERIYHTRRLEQVREQGGHFDRFTDRARTVLTLAQEEAQRFNHNYIGTEHLLLGLVREGEGVAAKVLSTLGVDLTKVRSAVEFIIGQGEQRVSGEIGLTPRAKKVIELGVDEARRLGHHYIGTEHLLLGLIREGEGIAAGILESLGVNLQKARSEVIKELTRPGEPPAG
jgi:ATP-dependent Clp protease ATP-binding subunit ClpC